jgi:hypothetical protein
LISGEKRVKLNSKLEKGKPLEKVGRKVTGLSLKRDKAAGLPDGFSASPAFLTNPG